MKSIFIKTLLASAVLSASTAMSADPDLVCQTGYSEGLSYIQCRALKNVDIYDYKVNDGFCGGSDLDTLGHEVGIVTTFREAVKNNEKEYKRWFKSNGLLHNEMFLGFEIYIDVMSKNMTDVFFEYNGQDVTRADFLDAVVNVGYNRRGSYKKGVVMTLNPNLPVDCRPTKFEVNYTVDDGTAWSHTFNWSW